MEAVLSITKSKGVAVFCCSFIVGTLQKLAHYLHWADRFAYWNLKDWRTGPASSYHAQKEWAYPHIDLRELR